MNKLITNFLPHGRFYPFHNGIKHRIHSVSKSHQGNLNISLDIRRCRASHKIIPTQIDIRTCIHKFAYFIFTVLSRRYFTSPNISTYKIQYAAYLFVIPSLGFLFFFFCFACPCHKQRDR